MRYVSSLILLCVIAGCSGGGADKPLPMFPVTGTLLIGGKPMENINIELAPVDFESKAKPGLGKTDAEGKFEIRTNGDRGATVGKFKVVLRSAASAPTGPVSIEEATKMSGQYAKTMGPPKPTSLPYPVEWGSPTSSPKEVEVVDKPVIVNIDI